MFEPIHGSAPRHAGQDRANPIAMIQAVQMMLEWLGERQEDERLLRAAALAEQAVARVLIDGTSLTYDLAPAGRWVSCSACGDAIVEEIARLA
jgi:3-isopropylmalate dehydrogenase